MKRLLAIILAAAMVIPSFAAPKSKKVKWIASWAPAMQLAEPHNNPPEPYLENNSLLQILQLSVGGEQMRVRLSNIFNEEDTEILGVEVAISETMGDRPVYDKSTLKTVYFNGSKSVTMKAGESIASDAFDFPTDPRANLAVIIHFGKASSTKVTSHPGSRTTSYIAKGNSMEFADAAKTDHWFILSGIDVDAKKNSRLISVIGDSITDGRGTTTNCQNRWTDILSKRLLANEGTEDVAVVNKGLGGNTVLRGGLGPTARTRYERDLFEEPGIKYIIIFEGVNDLGGSRNGIETANGIIEVYKEIIEKAKKKKIKVFGATVMPFKGNRYFTEDHEAGRQLLNEWIRTYEGFDGVIDFDAVMRDPADPQQLQRKYLFENDWLHVNAEGYKDMGNSINLDFFKLD